MTRYPMDPGEFLLNVAVADFDRDGHTDMATISLGNEAALFMRAGLGAGTFGALQADRTAIGVGGPVVADFNRDGRPDLTYAANPDHSRGGVAVTLNWSGLPAPPCVPGLLFRYRLRAARRELKRAGCRLARTSHRYSRKVRKNRVISQRPRSGAILPNGSKVGLTISRGPRR